MHRKAAKMMGALLAFCVAVGALLLWLVNTYDGEPELPKEQQGGQQSGRKRNRRKGKREGNKPSYLLCPFALRVRRTPCSSMSICQEVSQGIVAVVDYIRADVAVAWFAPEGVLRGFDIDTR